MVKFPYINATCITKFPFRSRPNFRLTLLTLVQARLSLCSGLDCSGLPTFAHHIYCFVRRIWAYQVSLFVPRSHDVSHPRSGLRIWSGLLSLGTISERRRRSTSPELILYIKIARLVSVFRKRIVPPSPSLCFRHLAPIPNGIHSYFYCSIP